MMTSEVQGRVPGEGDEAQGVSPLQGAVAPTVRVSEALADQALRGGAPALSVSDRVAHGSLRARLFGKSGKAPDPTRIGRFVIVRKIGAGGMGVVYSAYDEELDRKVAIKLLHADSAGSQGRARILREAQAVARISHPNVIHVYEVGELDNGQVFMAMEFVEGVTLAAWAHRKQRPWREILAVYLQVAQGLAAAHEDGLVHRDVKPENALINERGRVVILDFGLARRREGGGDTLDSERERPDVTGGGSIPDPELLTPAAAEAIAQTLTASGAIMGTPAYMSPEQCTGTPADARSDQFSFCVSLYEALYGERPFAGRELAKLIAAVCRGEVRDAPRGSKVPSWLRRVLLRGLAVNPRERWPSMQALAEALARDPARQRRRWLGVGAIAASLTLGAVGAAQPWSGGACRGADERLDGIWDMSRKTAVRDALLGTGYAYAAQRWPLVEARLDEYAGEWSRLYADACEAHQRGDTSSELYDRQMACLDARLGEVDSTVKVLAAADETVLQQAQELTNSLVPLSSCADTDSLRESYAPPPDQQTADAVAALRRQLVDIRVRAEAGHPVEVVEAAEGVVRAAETLGYRPLLAEALFQLGSVNLSSHRAGDAEEVMLKAFLTADAVRHDEIAAKAGGWLVFLNARSGQETEAKLRAEHVSAVIERYGRTSIADFQLQRGLATIDYINGRYDEARRGLRHALAIAESLPACDGARLSELIHVNIGQVCELQSDIPCVASNFEEAMERISSRLGPDDPKLSMYKFMLAKARQTQGRYDEARELVESAMKSSRDAFGEQHPLYVESVAWAAEIMILNGKLGVALRYAEEARAIAKKLDQGVEKQLHLEVLAAGILRQQGRYEEALARIEATQTQKDALPEGSPYVAKLLFGRAELLSDMGRFAEAKVAFEAYLAAPRPTKKLNGPYLAMELASVARVERELGNEARAAELLVQARESVTKISEDHWALVDPLRETAELALARGEHDEALAAAEHALEILKHGCSRLQRPQVRFLVARALAEREPARALEVAGEALAEESALEQPAPERKAAIEAWIAARRGA